MVKNYKSIKKLLITLDRIWKKKSKVKNHILKKYYLFYKFKD